MRVDDIGCHIPCFAPGGRSLVTMGMPGVTNTSQFSGMSCRVTTSVISLFPSWAELTERGSLLTLFPRNPLSDVGWAMEEFSTFLLTRAQEADYMNVHNRDFFQFQGDFRTAASR